MTAAEHDEVDVKAWSRELRGTEARLCPILNRGAARTGPALLDRADQMLRQGADGLAMWDWDSHLANPTYRLLAYHVGSKKGRQRLRKLWAKDWPVRQKLLTFDGVRVDRYHPGWNV
jgi:hypothetical protein